MDIASLPPRAATEGGAFQAALPEFPDSGLPALLVGDGDGEGEGQVAPCMQFTTLNACLTPACAMQQRHILTIEGMARLGAGEGGAMAKPVAPHPIQHTLAVHHGSQCGFCTPGIIMSMYAAMLHSTAAHPTTSHDVGVLAVEGLDGNLCRCTGYRPILDAAKAMFTDPSCVSRCQQDLRDMEELVVAFSPSNSQPTATMSSPLSFQNPDGSCWYQPTTIERALDLLHVHPDTKISNGHTELGIERASRTLYPHLMTTAHIECMKEVKLLHDHTGIWLGASMSLTYLQQELRHLCSRVLTPAQSRPLQALLAALQYFAGNQVRDVAVLAGNICTASPISDLNPVLLALGARMRIVHAVNGVREMEASAFFTGYRRMAL
jgi:xanthine dehydrogenase/oxidase